MTKKESNRILREIKDMLKGSHEFVQDIKENEKRIREKYSDMIKEERKEYSSDMDYWYLRRCEQLKQQCEQEILNMMYQHDGENSYYLIYKDGSCISIMDSDLISGEKMPKLTNIVYAMYSGPCDSWDTETGKLTWYEGSISEENFDYEAEDQRKMEYENAIEIKYGTEFGKRISKQLSL